MRSYCKVADNNLSLFNFELYIIAIMSGPVGSRFYKSSYIISTCIWRSIDNAIFSVIILSIVFNSYEWFGNCNSTCSCCSAVWYRRACISPAALSCYWAIDNRNCLIYGYGNNMASRCIVIVACVRISNNVGSCIKNLAYFNAVLCNGSYKWCADINDASVNSNTFNKGIRYVIISLWICACKIKCGSCLLDSDINSYTYRVMVIIAIRVSNNILTCIVNCANLYGFRWSYRCVLNSYHRRSCSYSQINYCRISKLCLGLCCIAAVCRSSSIGITGNCSADACIRLCDIEGNYCGYAIVIIITIIAYVCLNVVGSEIKNSITGNSNFIFIFRIRIESILNGTEWCSGIEDAFTNSIAVSPRFVLCWIIDESVRRFVNCYSVRNSLIIIISCFVNEAVCYCVNANLVNSINNFTILCNNWIENHIRYGYSVNNNSIEGVTRLGIRRRAISSVGSSGYCYVSLCNGVCELFVECLFPSVVITINKLKVYLIAANIDTIFVFIARCISCIFTRCRTEGCIVIYSGSWRKCRKSYWLLFNYNSNGFYRCLIVARLGKSDNNSIFTCILHLINCYAILGNCILKLWFSVRTGKARNCVNCILIVNSCILFGRINVVDLWISLFDIELNKFFITGIVTVFIVCNSSDNTILTCYGFTANFNVNPSFAIEDLVGESSITKGLVDANIRILSDWLIWPVINSELCDVNLCRCDNVFKRSFITLKLIIPLIVIAILKLNYNAISSNVYTTIIHNSVKSVFGSCKSGLNSSRCIYKLGLCIAKLRNFQSLLFDNKCLCKFSTIKVIVLNYISSYFIFACIFRLSG